MDLSGNLFRPIAVGEVARMDRDRTLRAPDAIAFRARDGFEVEWSDDLGERLLRFARDGAPNEWVGLLVGHVCRDAHGDYVRVLAAIPDEGASVGPGNVRTTPQSEGAVRAFGRRMLPEAVPVGWVHSHVNCGTVFSTTDRATQRTWSEPHAIGIVVDPWSAERFGVYRGPESERLARVLGDAARPQPTNVPEERPVLEGRSSRDLVARIVACVALVMGAWAIVRGSGNAAASVPIIVVQPEPCAVGQVDAGVTSDVDAAAEPDAATLDATDAELPRRRHRRAPARARHLERDVPAHPSRDASADRDATR